MVQDTSPHSDQPTDTLLPPSSARGFTGDEARRPLTALAAAGTSVMAVVHERLFGQTVTQAEDLLEGVPELLAEPAVEDEVAGRLTRQHDQRYVVHQLGTHRNRTGLVKTWKLRE